MIAASLPPELQAIVQGRSLPRVPLGRSTEIIAYCDAHDVAILSLRGMRPIECATCEDVQLQPDEQVVLDNTHLAATASSWEEFRDSANHLAARLLDRLPSSKRSLQVAFEFATRDTWSKR